MKNFIYQSSFFLLVIVAIGMVSCDREDPLEHPVVLTGDITDITPEGALFNGKITVSNPEEVNDHGFVFYDEYPYNIDNPSYRISLGPLESNLFSSAVLTPFVSGKKYYVRAYAKVKIHKFYGMEREFTSLAEGYPVIEKVEPAVATWGDTIRIHGKYFSHGDGNAVSIGGIQAVVVSAKADMIVVLVPHNLNSVKPVITLSVLDRKVTAAFSLSPPEITGFSPERGRTGTEVIIHGKYFLQSIFNITKVFFGNIPVITQVLSDTRIRVISPSGEPNGPMNISVSVLDQVAIADSSFLNVQPVITSFYPETATWGDTVKITGMNFLTNRALTTVKLDYNIVAPVTGVYQDSIFVKIPNDYDWHGTRFTVLSQGETTVVSENLLSMKTPVITSFEPAAAYLNDTITIYGKYFHPNDNRVEIAGHGAHIISYSKSMIKVLVPLSLTGSGNITVHSGSFSTRSEVPFTLTERVMILKSVSPMEITRNDTPLTIRGENIDIYNKPKVYIGNQLVDLISVSDEEIKTNLPSLSHGEHFVKIVQGKQQLTYHTPIKYYEPWKTIFRPAPIFCEALSFVIGDRYFTGGDTGEFWEFNPTNQSFTSRSNIPFKFQYGDGARTGSFCTASYGYYMKAGRLFRYDPAANQWEEKASLPVKPDVPCNAFAIDNVGYMVAGTVTLNEGGNNGITGRRVYRYREQIDQWEAVASLPTVGFRDGISFTHKGNAYLGLGGGSPEERARIWQYDPVANTWSQKIDVTELICESCHSIVEASVLQINNQVYIMGGRHTHPNSNYLSKSILAFRYDPDTNIFIPITYIPWYTYRGTFHFSFENGGIIGSGHRDEYHQNMLWLNPDKLMPGMKP